MVREGVDAFKTLLHLTFTRTVARMRLAVIREVGKNLGWVNDSKWNGFDPLTLAYSNFTQDEQVATITVGTAGTTKLEYPVVVELIYDPEGWTPSKLVETFHDSDVGVEVPIVDIETGEPVESTFNVARSFNIGRLFSVLASGNPNYDSGRT